MWHLVRELIREIPLWWWLFVGVPTLAMMMRGLEREPLQHDSELPEPGALRGNKFRQRHCWEKPRHGPLAK